MKPTTSKYITVKKSKIHSTGIFAKKFIPKGTKIIEYVGEIISKKESDKRAVKQLRKHITNKHYDGAVYIFDLTKNHDIDGNVSWNTAKWINHSCEPNCEAENIDEHIWIIALRDINKGEELSYDYGYSIDDYEDHPCHCGSKKCVGYIVSEDKRSKLRKILNSKKKSNKNI